jgi:hypothetical protein
MSGATRGRHKLLQSGRKLQNDLDVRPDARPVRCAGAGLDRRQWSAGRSAMNGFLLLLAATIASIELLTRSRLIPRMRALVGLGRRMGALTERRGVSAWARRRALRLLALRLLFPSLTCLGALVLIAAPFLFVLALDRIEPIGVRQAWGGMTARLALLVLAALYLVARQRVTQPQIAEAPGQRLLQRIALGGQWVPKLSFDLERRIYLARANARPAGRPVFVAGPPLAGATPIIRALLDSDHFAALTDHDLPFALAPNLWDELRHALRRKHEPRPIRDPDGTGSFEELFWRHHEGVRYIRPDGLRLVPPSSETIAAFADYVRLVQLRYGRQRYLSANNNNVLRLPALLAAFPDAQLIHPFRDPLQQAASLLDQHRRAVALAAEDSFHAQLMAWLGHHEFGADHRPLLLPGAPGRADDPNRLDYWLKSWIATYRFLLKGQPAIAHRQLFVDYDRLVDVDDGTGAVLARELRLPAPLDLSAPRAPKSTQPQPSSQLLREAAVLYAALRRRAVAAPGAARSAAAEKRAARAQDIADRSPESPRLPFVPDLF